MKEKLIKLVEQSLGGVQKCTHFGVAHENTRRLDSVEIDLIEVLALLRSTPFELKGKDLMQSIPFGNEHESLKRLRAFGRAVNENLRSAKHLQVTTHRYVLDWGFDEAQKKCSALLRSETNEVWKFHTTQKTIEEAVNTCMGQVVWFFMISDFKNVDEQQDRLQLKS